MTKDRAIQVLQKIKETATGVVILSDGKIKAIDMAIESLSEPSIVRCKDCIYYETCNLRLSHWWKGGYTVDIEFCSFGKRREP